MCIAIKECDSPSLCSEAVRSGEDECCGECLSVVLAQPWVPGVGWWTADGYVGARGGGRGATKRQFECGLRRSVSSWLERLVRGDGAEARESAVGKCTRGRAGGGRGSGSHAVLYLECPEVVGPEDGLKSVLPSPLPPPTLLQPFWSHGTPGWLPTTAKLTE